MTFGVSIEKQGIDLRKFYNVYYTNLTSMEDALDLGVLLSTAEAKLHGSSVTFNKVHAWEVGATTPNFNNRSLSNFGDISSSTPTMIELCMHFEFAAQNSYPSAKYYRVQLNSAFINGRFWASTVGDAVSEYLDMLEEQKPYLTNRNGVLLDVPAYKGRIAVRQYNKRWYNKTNGLMSE